MLSALFAEKFLVPFIPVATVVGIGGSCLYIYSDDVFGPGSGYDIFIVAQSTNVTPDVDVDLYLDAPKNEGEVLSGNVASVSLFRAPLFDATGGGDSSGQPDNVANPSVPAEPKPPVVKKQRNYQCDISTDSDKPVNKSCYLTKKFEFDDTSNSSKKWLNLSHIGIPQEYDYLIQNLDKPIIEAPSEVSKSDLKVENKYFVIQVTESLFNQIKWEEGQTINISPLGDSTKFFGKLKPLFAVYSSYVGIATEYVLTKVENIAYYEPEDGKGALTEVGVDSSSSDKEKVDNVCFLDGIGDLTTNSGYVCEFNKFSQNTHTGDAHWYKTETFSGSFAAAEKIEKDKYYLVKFDQKFFAKRISNMSLSYLVSVKDSGSPAKKAVVTMGPAYPVAVIGSTSAHKLFILTQN